MKKKISLFNTYIDPLAIEYLKKVLENGFLSEGNEVKKFESELEKIFNSKVITVNSGTSALHLALRAAGVKEGDEVMLPAQTFIATALAVMYCKATPVFVDIDTHTGNIDIKDIPNKITNRTRVIIPVHWGGYPCDMDEIIDLAKSENLIIIEDAAHAIGGVYKNKFIGSISDMTCFSFQAIKHLTTGDGGCITTNNNLFYEYLVRYRWFGIHRDFDLPNELGERQYDIKEIGYKYHMNNITASIGRANLLTLQERLNRRRKIAENYFNKLRNISGLKCMNYTPDRLSSYWLFPLLVEKRNSFIKHMKSSGIEVSVVHQGIHKYSIFRPYLRGDLPQQDYFDLHQIHLPIHELLDDDDIDYILQTIKKGW